MPLSFVLGFGVGVLGLGEHFCIGVLGVGVLSLVFCPELSETVFDKV